MSHRPAASRLRTRRSAAEPLEERLVLNGVPVSPPSFASADGIAEANGAFIGMPDPAPAATADSTIKTFDVGTYVDTNKTWVNDSKLCWAASAANLLAYTNWGYSVAAPQTGGRPLFRSGSEILSYFAQNFTNDGGYTLAGFEWFITGIYNYPSNYARPTGGGGLYPGLPLSSTSLWPLVDAPAETMMARMADYLERGYGVSLGIGFYQGGVPNERVSGHALTVWGYTYDTSFAPSDPNYYTGLILTDSDDGYTGTRTCSLFWSPEYNLYRLLDYGNDSAFVEYFVCLKPTRPLTGITVNGYYGPASVPMMQYVYLWQKVSGIHHAGIYDMPDAAYLAESGLRWARMLLLQAASLAKGTPYAERIEREALSIRYALLARESPDTPGHAQAVDDFMADVRRLGITELFERKELEASGELLRTSRYAKDRRSVPSIRYPI